jgi:uncharacterized protein
MEGNPFKFGSVVEGKFFTNRINEIENVRSLLKSENHLIMVSPRRFGKTSLLMKVVSDLNRPFLYIDLQMVLSVNDLAAQLLKRLYRNYPFERVRQLVRRFRITPSITLNPVTNEVDITFQASLSGTTIIEDVLNTMEKLSTRNRKLIVIMDEFQQVTNLDKDLPAKLRAVMQHHKKINYVFMGSQESLIREIFEKKKSPFYHFGIVFLLGKIPELEFKSFISDRLHSLSGGREALADKILAVTGGHPYYTQQLAFYVWETLNRNKRADNPLEQALSDLGRTHDMDYERLWNTINRTDRKILTGLAASDHPPLSSAFCLENQIESTSTAYSGLLRLSQRGFLIKVDDKYQIDDPFFKLWIIKKRITDFI